MEGEALIYIMNSTGIFPPSADYLSVIQEGYRDFCMPQKAYRLLHEAVRASWDDKAPSDLERRRYEHEGRPKLALPRLRKRGHSDDRDHARDEQV